jgi:hypothetical protein
VSSERGGGMMHWTPGRLRVVGYVSGTIGALLIAAVAASHPRSGLVLLGVAVLLVLAGACAIWLAQSDGGTSR